MTAPGGNGDRPRSYPPVPAADALSEDYTHDEPHPWLTDPSERHHKLPDAYVVLAEFLGEQPSPLLREEDAYNPNRSPFNPHALVRAHLYREIVPIIDSYHDLEIHLRVYPYIAHQLGFEDDSPSDDTLRRAWQDRFPESVRSQIEEIAEGVRDEVEAWAAVDTTDIIQQRGFEADDPAPDPEGITLADKLAAIAHAKPLMYDVLDFDRAHNAHFAADDLLDLQAQISRETEFLNKVVEEAREDGEDVPAARSYFRNIEKFTAEEWHERFRQVYSRQLEAAKGAGVLDEEVAIYIDGTVIPFYQQNAGLPEGVIGGYEQRGTYYGYHYVTAVAQADDRSLIVATYPMLENSELQEAVQYCIRRAEQHVDISDVAMDSEFRKADTLAWLHDRGYEVTLQYPTHGNRIRRALARMEGEFDFADYTITSSDRRTSIDVTLLGEPDYDEVDSDFTFERSDPTGGQAGLEEWGATEDLDSLPLEDVDERLWKGRRSYVTTHEVEDVADVKRVLADYKHRWRIETAFRVVKDNFLARTTSRKYEVRTFYWLYAVMLYNSWALLDVFLRADYPDEAPDDRPVMTARSFAKRFIQTAYSRGD